MTPNILHVKRRGPGRRGGDRGGGRRIALTPKPPECLRGLHQAAARARAHSWRRRCASSSGARHHPSRALSGLPDRGHRRWGGTGTGAAGSFARQRKWTAYRPRTASRQVTARVSVATAAATATFHAGFLIRTHPGTPRGARQDAWPLRCDIGRPSPDPPAGERAGGRAGGRAARTTTHSPTDCRPPARLLSHGRPAHHPPRNIQPPGRVSSPLSVGTRAAWLVRDRGLSPGHRRRARRSRRGPPRRVRRSCGRDLQVPSRRPAPRSAVPRSCRPRTDHRQPRR